MEPGLQLDNAAVAATAGRPIKLNECHTRDYPSYDDLLRERDEARRMMDRGASNLVLIDGDALNFADELVRGGLNGGEEAALGLLRATFREFEYYDDFRRDEKIVIKVYANLKGLSKTYVCNKILGRAEDFYEFVTGFNKMNALVDLTDAGNAKDGADRKLQETLDLNLYNVHCKRIVLGASTDGTYASHLNKFYDIDVPSRVLLLEGPEWAREFLNILHKYRVINFGEIFRGKKLNPAYGSPRESAPQINDSKRRSNGFESGWKRAREGDVRNARPFVTRPRERSSVSPPEPKQRVTSTRTSSGSMEAQSSSVAPAPVSNGSGPAAGEGALVLAGHLSPAESESTPSSNAVVPMPSQASMPGYDDLAVERALVHYTLAVLARDVRQVHFGAVKLLAARELGVDLSFWGTKGTQDPRWEESNRVIKWTVEHWMERTDTPPPGNAMWMLRNFPRGVSPAEVLRHPSASSWRVQGEASWEVLFEEIDRAVQAHLYRAMAM